MSRQMSRTPPPRQLGTNETLESLTHWKTTFRTFYKKDDAYRIFFKSDAKWNHSQPNYDLADETVGEKRKAADLSEDLVDLLNTLAGYLPHSYLTDKILKSQNWDGVYKTIFDHYNVQVTSETLLDFENIHKKSEETHRQFFERLLQHAKQHLAPKDVKVEDLTNTTDDKMTISLMNMVALQWLRKESPDLISIVRTEYSTELRSNVQLAALVPRIAPNIDSLLRRYEQGSRTNKVTLPASQQETVDAADVNKTWGRGFQRNRGGGRATPRGSRPPGRGGSTGRGAGPFCPGCYYLSQQLGTTIHFRHTPGDCPRKAVAVKMFQMEDQEFFEDEIVEDFAAIGKIADDSLRDDDIKFQISKTNWQTDWQGSSGTEQSTYEIQDGLVETTIVHNIQTPTNFELSHDAQYVISDPKMDLAEVQTWISKIQKLESRKSTWINTGVRKSKSPCILAKLEDSPVYTTIDEGSEINCMDEGFAMKNKVKFVPTICKATAAGSTTMDLAGQTHNPISINIPHNNPIILNLGKMIIVKNLGVDILLGEPGKQDNEIVTIPHKKLVEFTAVDGKRVRLAYSSKYITFESSTFHCKSTKQETIYPNQSLKISLPIGMRNATEVAVTARNPSLHPWVKCKILPVDLFGTINISNESSVPVKLSKHEHFANINACVDASIDDLKSGDYVRKIYDIGRNDLSHLIPHKEHGEAAADEDGSNEVCIDPDDNLSADWKARFKSICGDFSDIITPRPGKYNGFFGRIDNSINFSSTPPPSVRAHLPKYSYDMLQIMADKMDKLEEWGVLRKPEDVGVVPEFVVASMLRPKAEEGEWRLVTDFTPLNIHIKKLETVAPTIKEAKEKLAKYKYHIQLDLSNYFYQGGMKVEDIQYLATPHPFKGLRVYTCEPQGLKNASEHAYERLGLVYGDMCREESITRMADGLYVLSDTLEGLEANFVEVLNRARLCGFTFKPSKIIIAPQETILFGWKLSSYGWKPTSHTIAPLIKAELPTTVKQARSWIGSYKQLIECIPRYAILLGPIEAVLGGRGSAERIVWTEDLIKTFERCKKSLNDIRIIHVPKPSDTLHTFSDYSQSAKAVGGRLEIHRVVNGKVKKLLGGHFSCRVSKHQGAWFPCEGEGLATRLVLEHFSDFIRESKNQTTHHTDNQPVVQAWKRSKTGAFSASARIAAFLSGVSAMNIEIIHTPGSEMKSSDYNSRNPEECTEKRCQICKFASKLETIGDKVAKITVDDIEKGRVKMPFIQKAAWLKVQKNDPVHQQLSLLIDSSQLPNKKKTKGNNTVLKRLHNMYKVGQLTKATDGLITVTHTDPDRGNYQAISIPTPMYPGLIQALHLKLDHPSKLQLQRLSTRYFYCPGFGRIIEEISSNCVVCASLKQMPDEILSQSTSETSIFGGNFSSDVIRIHGQKILLTREKLSQFTMTKLINDETAESLKNALVSEIIEFIPTSGTIVQVDCATACQSLKTESEVEGSTFQKLGIEIDLGRTLNKNKNPIAENAIKEFHKERLRINPAGGPVTEMELALITKNMNSRIRNRGLSSKEIVLQRDQVTNESKPISDHELSKEQFERRTLKHPSEISESNESIKPGNNVFLKADKNKLRGREMYRVVDLFVKNKEKHAKLQKSETQFRSKIYDAKLSEIFLVPGNISTTEEDDGIPVGEEEAMVEDQETDSINEDLVNTENVEDSDDERLPMSTPAPVRLPSRRIPRKSAIESSKQLKELISGGLLNIKAAEKKPPSHGWDWDQFLNMMDYDVTSSISRPCSEETDNTVEHNEPLDDIEYEETQELSANHYDKSVFVMNFQELTNLVGTDDIDMQRNVLDMTIRELEHSVRTPIDNQPLQWDDSPEQYELSFQENDPDDDTSDPIFQSTPLFPEPTRDRLPAHPTDSHDDSLTSEEAETPVFFQENNSPIADPDQQFNRAKGLRKKQSKPTPQNYLERVLPIPNRPDDVCTTEAQILSQVLPPRHETGVRVLPPARPEAVVLGPQAPVQNIDRVLDVLQEVTQDARADTPTRRPRAPINYKRFHSSGQR